jgi:hypothetical protein
VPTPALTPALALDYLDELSTDIESVVVLDRDGNVAAATAEDDDRRERMQELVIALLDRAAEAVPGSDQLEVQTPEGSVFAVRGSEWSIGVVAGRKPLASLMFYDLRNVVADLGDPGTGTASGTGAVRGTGTGTAPGTAHAPGAERGEGS